MISILCLHGGAATKAIRSLIARNSREAGSATTNANITAAEKDPCKGKFSDQLHSICYDILSAFG